MIKGTARLVLEASLCGLLITVFSICFHMAFPLCTRANSVVPSCSSKDTRPIVMTSIVPAILVLIVQGFQV